MTEQSAVTQSLSKSERSKENTSCRASYECLMSATKSFVLNFSSLSDEEKAEFKSLVNYVKQLQKCMENIKSINSGTVHVVRKSARSLAKRSSKSSSEQSQEVKAEAEAKVEVKLEKSKRGKKEKEVSPTLTGANPSESVVLESAPTPVLDAVEVAVSKAVSRDLKSGNRKPAAGAKKSA